MLPSQSILQTAWLYSLSRMLECYNVSQYITLHPLPSPTMSQCKIPHKRNTNVPICCSYRTTFELELSALCSGHTIHNTIIICQLPPQTLTGPWMIFSGRCRISKRIAGTFSKTPYNLCSVRTLHCNKNNIMGLIRR